MGHGIPSNCPKHCLWIQKDLWPCCSMGTSPKACYSALVEAAHKLMQLVDRSADWVYTFIQLIEALSHTPLSSKDHVSAMMDGTPTADAHSQVQQLQVHKLSQHKDLVVCPDGLNSGVEVSQFTFQELYLRDTANPGEPTYEPQLMEVGLGGIQSQSVTTTIQTATFYAGPTPSGQYC